MPGVKTALSYDIGTDQAYAFTTYANDAQSAIREITGWALSFQVKRADTDADVNALVTKTTTGGGIVISGTFNATPSVNTQIATVTIVDTDTDTIPAGLYKYELKRTDAGQEARLAYGMIAFQQTLHRA